MEEAAGDRICVGKRKRSSVLADQSGGGRDGEMMGAAILGKRNRRGTAGGFWLGVDKAERDFD